MDLDFECDEMVKVSMIPYMEEIIKNFPEEVGTSIAATPAAEHLCQIREEKDVKLIPEEQAIQFHHTAAKLLFVTTRAHRDIQTAIAFLTT